LREEYEYGCQFMGTSEGEGGALRGGVKGGVFEVR